MISDSFDTEANRAIINRRRPLIVFTVLRGRRNLIALKATKTVQCLFLIACSKRKLTKPTQIINRSNIFQ